LNSANEQVKNFREQLKTKTPFAQGRLPQAQTASLDQNLAAGLGLKHPCRRKHLS